MMDQPAPSVAARLSRDGGRTLGIIAGSGDLPHKLVRACECIGISVFIVALKGYADSQLIEGRAHLWARIGNAGKIIATLKDKEIRDLVFVGAVRRPGLRDMAPDLRTARFLAKAALQFKGDDALLRAMRRELEEEEGFTLHGIHHFVTDLLCAHGQLGRIAPDREQQSDIQTGIEIARAIGALDIGQSVIVQNGLVLGVEAIEGTDELIRRCFDLHRKGRGGVLVKMAKPQQDTDLDLPTIGPETVRNAARNGLSGIAVHAGRSLMLDPEQCRNLADEAGIFLCGVVPDAGSSPDHSGSQDKS